MIEARIFHISTFCTFLTLLYLCPACHRTFNHSFMNFMELIGLSAAILTTTAFFPQVIKTIRTKSTTDLSLPMYTLMFTGTVCWLVYGMYKHDVPLMLANGISSLASFIIFYYKLREFSLTRKNKQ